MNNNELMRRTQHLHAAAICIPCGSGGVVPFDTYNIGLARMNHLQTKRRERRFCHLNVLFGLRPPAATAPIT
jgi:hypothetical protein